MNISNVAQSVLFLDGFMVNQPDQVKVHWVNVEIFVRNRDKSPLVPPPELNNLPQHGITTLSWVGGELTGAAINASGKRYELVPKSEKPIDMILFCPACGLQHLDEQETCEDEGCPHYGAKHTHPDLWNNPPHRSHLCGACGHQWRPADVPTNGVLSIKTRGEADNSKIVHQVQAVDDFAEIEREKRRLLTELDFLLNGAGVAKSPSLIDIIAQVRNEGIKSKNYIGPL